MRAVRWLVLPLLLVLAAACGDSSSEPRVPSIAGSWRGTGGGFTVNLVLTSTGTGGAVTGTGTISGGGQPLAITVTGTHAHPNVSLNASAPGFEPINFQGAFTNDNTIAGTLNGSGFNNFAMTLQRQ